jgi:hypothetical protein
MGAARGRSGDRPIMNCMCDWPAECGGLGTLICEGCGGDTCVCLCGGEMSCYGCEYCRDIDDDDDWDYVVEGSADAIRCD